jgi:hypothetical protein
VQKELDSSPVAVAIEVFLEDNSSGYTGNLQGLLDQISPYRFKSDELAGWSVSAKRLKTELQRQQAAFRKVGVHINFDDQRRSDGYQVRIERI